MHIFITVVILAIVYCIYRICSWYISVMKPLIEGSASLPHPPKHWLLGNLIDHPGVCEAGLYWWSSAAEKCGKIFRLFHAFEPQLYLSHPETAREILKSGEPKPMTRIPGYGIGLPWLGNGLLFADGERWLRNRRLLTPAFHFEMLRNYVDVFNVTADTMVRRCGDLGQDGKSFDIFPVAGFFTLDTVLRCAFSYDTDVQRSGEKVPIVRLTNDAIMLFLARCFNPVYWPEIIWWMSPKGRKFWAVCKEYNAITRRIILEREKQMKDFTDNNQTKIHHDFLDILLKARDEDGNGLTEEEVRAEVNTFLFAGHDTTSSAISYTLYQLSKFPEHQEKCRAEIEDIMEGRETDEIVWDDISKMKHLALCLKEAMRVHTTLPIISRYTTREHEINGHKIPKGMVVNIMLFMIHMQPDVWGDPENYRPERFLPDEVAKRDAYSFVPFSAGPRNCIGQNFALNLMRVALAKILRNYKVGFDEERPLRRRPEGVLKSETGVWLTFTPLK